MDKSNGALMGFKVQQWPAFNSLPDLWREGWIPVAVGLVGLGLLTLFVVCLFSWRDPSINWDVIASQVKLHLSDI